ncbi:ribonuclease H1 domain-containing protein [Membranihabitans marinus]|uniref:ribonuclease H1 domain-containing protein n=1 Tax=Membranihabitans marinus TaxID=1227546 RepID=UPI001F1BEBF9|nr:ribonuclease H family protein [Membranihabitans marinus]
MSKKSKYYVVWEGLNPGIYDSWSKCQENIKGYPNAKYKSYPDAESATLAFREGWKSSFKAEQKKVSAKPSSSQGIIMNSISVDAASSGNPGRVEYQGVWTHNKQLIFHQGPFEQGTNNLGEFLALVHALAMLDKKKAYQIPIYSDSKTAQAWVRNKKIKTTLERNNKNAALFELVDRAEKWLKEHEVRNPILKWDTVNWGEIPADFGRK